MVPFIGSVYFRTMCSPSPPGPQSRVHRQAPAIRIRRKKFLKELAQGPCTLVTRLFEQKGIGKDNVPLFIGNNDPDGSIVKYYVKADLDISVHFVQTEEGACISNIH